jgi:hypothetical protein
MSNLGAPTLAVGNGICMNEYAYNRSVLRTAIIKLDAFRNTTLFYRETSAMNVLELECWVWCAGPLRLSSS